MDFAAIENLMGLIPYGKEILFGLGLLVIVITGVDLIIPDSKDGGFSSKIANIPILGGLWNFLKRFSLRRLGVSDEQPK